MRIRIANDRGVSYNGDHLEGGEEYEIDDHFGRVLISQGRAEAVDGEPEGERETVPAHRDKAVRRATRG